jgi:hypothetical protein
MGATAAIARGKGKEPPLTASGRASAQEHLGCTKKLLMTSEFNFRIKIIMYIN